MNSRLQIGGKKSAFSLIELLVVIAIIAVIGGFAVPAVGNLLKGTALTQAANMITDTIAGARQHALTRNRSVEVRFFRFWNTESVGEPVPSAASDLDTKPPGLNYTAQYRAFQAFEIGDGGIANPIGKLAMLPNTVILSAEPALSSLLGNTDPAIGPVKTTWTANDPELPRGVGTRYEYVAFRFQPDGATTLSPNNGPSNGLWFITVHLLDDTKNGSSSSPPPNFFTLMIDPVSGSAKIMRPGVK
jgi:prepilin-type N-terminal cleavage/methylation domain-containing protein